MSNPSGLPSPETVVDHGDLTPGDVTEPLSPAEAERIGRLMLCAIGRSPDGSVSLTVYEDGRAATLQTDASGAQMLADMLTGRGQ